jgi:Protein of unknown function (DUF3307)
MNTIEIFLILCLGHLASDFLLQTDAMVKDKKHGGAAAYGKHGVIHYVAILVVAAFADPALLVRIRFQTICIALIAAHLLIDFCKERLTAAAKIRDDALTFLADQSVHAVTIVAAALLITGTSPVVAVERLEALVPRRDKILAVLVIYFAVVFAGGYAIRYLTRPLTRHLPQLGDETIQSLRNAGMYIGWLERSLVLTAMILRSPATVGLVLAAKSIARFPELGKSERFAEYFLIGTLLSLLAAIFGGIVLLKVLTGRVTLGQ